jgi:integrase
VSTVRAQVGAEQDGHHHLSEVQIEALGDEANEQSREAHVMSKQRAKGTGTIFQPKNSQFYWIAYMSGGKRRYESTKKTTATEAQKVLTSRLGDVVKGIVVTPKMGRKTLGEGLKGVVEDQTMNGCRSVAHTQRRIDLHLLKYFAADCKMANITTSDLTAYRVHRLKEGASAASTNLELSVLKRAFTLAMRAQELMHAPHIPMSKLHNTREGFLEQDQFEAVCDKLPEALRPVVKFAYFTGWRVASEVLPLEWSQVDRNAMKIRLVVGTTKNGEGRTLPYRMLPDVVAVIEAAWKEHERLIAADKICPFVFNRNGEQIRAMRGAWESACVAAGCPGKLLHDLRRTAVRNLVRAGVPEKQAMKITGHKTRSVFDRYDIVNDADLEVAVGRLADYHEMAPAKPTAKVTRFKSGKGRG